MASSKTAAAATATAATASASVADQAEQPKLLCNIDNVNVNNDRDDCDQARLDQEYLKQLHRPEEENEEQYQHQETIYSKIDALVKLSTTRTPSPSATTSTSADKGNHKNSNKNAPIVEASRHLLQPNGSISGEAVARAILPLFPTFSSAIPGNNMNPAKSSSQDVDYTMLPASNIRAALAGSDNTTREPISHDMIHSFITQDFGPKLHELGYGRGDRIALVLPNGPELALAILCTVHWASCVPLNAFGAHTELQADLVACGADLVIGLQGTGTNATYYQHVHEIASKLDIPFIGLDPSKTKCGIFSLKIPTNYVSRRTSSTTTTSSTSAINSNANPITDNKLTLLPNQQRTTHSSHHHHHHRNEADMCAGAPPIDNHQFFRYQSDLDLTSPNAHDDEVLVLFTSGTTGSKKLVAHLLGEILVATTTICLSWNLTADDVNCNLMPLFHVGGIVRQVFSPVLSGGCVICCPNFDPAVFWSLLERKKFNWYYAAPTMHQLILQTQKERKLPPRKLRMIANAAGGLLPSLARELRDAFHANVLPSYGMTECMPISSPPWNYQLERPGTSGVSVGPEIAIINVITNSRLSPLTEGPICVRGFPCFRGYSPTTQDGIDFDSKSSFLNGGWFNTGDLGYLDKDGYLYITGRSKEVINRGGEIISPLEVEEAVASHPDVEAALAFSVAHDVLQEVVGIAIVPVPNRPRLDMQSLHEFLGDNRLTAPKWPQCLVFMNGGLPKSATNKLLRTKLGERLGLPVMTDSTHPIERTFEAECPPQASPINLPIPSWHVAVDPRTVEASLSEAVKAKLSSESAGITPPSFRLLVLPHQTRKGCLVCYTKNLDVITILNVAEKCLHRYAVPSFFVSVENMNSRSTLPPPSKQHSAQAIKERLLGRPEVTDKLIMELQSLFQGLLDLECMPHPESNFFNLGGSSMLASKLAAAIRRKFKIMLSGSEVFHHATCAAIAKLVREQKALQSSGRSTTPTSFKSHENINKSYSNYDNSNAPQDGSQLVQTNCLQTHSLTGQDSDISDFNFPQKRLLPVNPGCCVMFFQSIPLLILYPLYTLLQYLLLLCTLLLVLTNEWHASQKLAMLAVALFLFNIAISIISPLLFLLIKWSVMGRYAAGRYPVFGSYYLRWWFVDVCRKFFGKGMFSTCGWSLNLYYRLLGAKIGRGTRISPGAEIAEYDLVKIGDGVALDDCVFRGFAVDNGCMILGTVGIGNNSSVGTKSIVAPHTLIPDCIHLGPQTSSYDVAHEKCVQSSNAQYNRMTFTPPNVMFTLFGHFILFSVQLCSQIPTLMLWYMLIIADWNQQQKFDSFGHAFQWLCEPQRVPLYLGIRYSRKLIEPILYMLVAIFVKWTFIGKFQPGPRGTSQYQLLRCWLASELFQKDHVQSMTDLIGRHFELVSCMYRALGATVGKRVFWPGTHIEFSGQYDLLEIGDDAVFGSRTTIMCEASDRLDKVRLCAGANVADNCVVLPGATIGKNAVLGAYGLCPADWYLPESSVWFGARAGEPVMLEKGVVDKRLGSMGGSIDYQSSNDSVGEIFFCDEGDESTLRPFGKAIYNRDSTYFVMPLPLIMLTTLAVNLLIITIHAFPLIGSIHLSGALLYGSSFYERDYSLVYDTPTVFAVIFTIFCVTHFLRVMVWAAIEIGAKWALLGQREAGVYNWDASSYNQRWEILQLLQKVRSITGNTIQDFITGSPFLAILFRLQGCTIGKSCCLWPTGGDPFPSEIDLITIGDRCVIDDGRLVCHLNTRGNFELTPIVLEHDVTLRRMTKIQKGALIEFGAMVLEHSLVMTGETVESNSVWQGSPAVCVWTNEGALFTKSCHNDLQSHYSSIV